MVENKKCQSTNAEYADIYMILKKETQGQKLDPGLLLNLYLKIGNVQFVGQVKNLL